MPDPGPALDALAFAALRLLADGESHRCEEVARRLDASCELVQEALRSIAGAGISLRTTGSRGVQLPEPIDWLRMDLVEDSLRGSARGIEIELVDQTDSTNRQLMQRAASGNAHRAVFATEWQSGGRGRQERRWLTGIGEGLTFSLGWRFNADASSLAGLSLAVGVGLIRALHPLQVDDLGLKWPNDILRCRRKLAGILIELVANGPAVLTAVVGIGINCRLSRKTLGQITQPAADLSDLLRTGAARLNRSVIFGAVLTEVVAVCEQFAIEGFPPFREEWLRYHAFQDRPVRLKLGNDEFADGIALGATSQGALRLLTAAGERQFHSGELDVGQVRPGSPIAADA